MIPGMCAEEVKARLGLSGRQPGPAGGLPPDVPDHQMVRCIGCGSYGEVWLARNTLGTWRAVKVVYRDRFQDPRPYEREFAGIRKYEPVSRANNGLVDVLHIGRNETQGYFYYVMELADDAITQRASRNADLGPDMVRDAVAYVPRTLAHEIKTHGRVPVDECISLGISLCLATGHLHRNGLIHRDVKPSNIIFVNGVPKLADIGLVTHFANADSFVGTEGFMPPEGPNSPQADLYALGKVLYEASMGKDRNEFPEPRSGLALDADSRELMEFNAVLLRACAPAVADRYQSAEQMAADLALLHSGQSVRQKHALERRLKITRRLAIGIAVVMLLGLLPYYLVIKEAYRAKVAEADTKEKLWNSYLAQAQAKRWSGRPGRRFEAIEVLKQAALFRPSIELRNEAIACLALSDLQPVKSWRRTSAFPKGPLIVNFDKTYDRYGVLETNGLFRILRLTNDTEVLQIPGFDPPLPDYGAVLEFSTDGRWLAVASGAQVREVEIWDLERKRPIEHLEGRFCRTLEFSPDSHTLAVSLTENHDEHCPIVIYSLLAERIVASFDHQSLPYKLCFGPQGQLATSSQATREVLVWDLQSAAPRRRLRHPAPVAGLGWSPRGDQLVTACDDGHVYIWDLNTEERVPLLGSHGKAARNASFSLDGDFLGTFGWDGNLRIWDAASRRQVFGIAASWLVSDFGGTSRRMAYASEQDKLTVTELELAHECRLLRPGDESHFAPGENCDFSQDSKLLIAAHEDGARIWDLASGKVIAFLAENRTRWALFGPGTNHCLVASDNGVREWNLDDPRSESQAGKIAFRSSRSICQTPAGEIGLSRRNSVLTYFAEHDLHITSLVDGRDRVLRDVGAGWMSSALSENGTLLALNVGTTTAAQKTMPVKVFDLGDLKQVKEIPQEFCGRSAFSPDHRWLMVGDHFEYRLWDTATWRSCYAIPKTAVGTWGFLAFSQDSSMVAVALERDLVHLVETASGRFLARLEPPEAQEIANLSFSPDGTRLAVIYQTGNIHLWDLALIRKELVVLHLDWGSPAVAGR
jgi:WD40 repeat protein